MNRKDCLALFDAAVEAVDDPSLSYGARIVEVRRLAVVGATRLRDELAPRTDDALEDAAVVERVAFEALKESLRVRGVQLDDALVRVLAVEVEVALRG